MELPGQDVCYRALQSRDARFDGLIFVGVSSTGIYCRPICPARTPKPVNCEFFVPRRLAGGRLSAMPALPPGDCSGDGVVAGDFKYRVARAGADR